MLARVRCLPASLWLLVLAGVAIRLVLAFAFFGNGDLRVFEGFEQHFEREGLRAYGFNVEGSLLLWPYPPGYLAWLVGAAGLADVSGAPFHGVVQLAPIAADVGVALAIYLYLGSRGASDRMRLAGAALVLLGPVFIAISGYHGQFDAVAILPGVVALIVWERAREGPRAIGAGALLGLGAAVKTVPALLALALVPSARSRREAMVTLAATAFIPLLVVAPFYIAEPEAVRDALGFQGQVASRGGLSLLADPGHAIDVVGGGRAFFERPNAAAEWLVDNSAMILGVGLLALTVFLLRRRPAAVDAAVLVWLTVYVLAPSFLLQYLVWGLPFFIMAGYLRQVAVLQLALVPALLITYVGPLDDPDPLRVLYVVEMAGLWVAFALALVWLLRRPERRGRVEGDRPPLVDLAERSV